MELFQHLRQRNWPTIFGYGLFAGTMAVGYYYNLTFVQIGLHDLGTRLIGMSEHYVATAMAYLALLTCATALAFGLLMRKLGWSRRFVLKLRLAAGIVAFQTILTAVAQFIRSEDVLFAWIVAASLALGAGVPVTFSMTVDLIPVKDRGYVAAIITAAAYSAATVLSSVWKIERFTAQMLWFMPVGVGMLGVLAFKPWAFVDRLAQQHTLPEFGQGRFVYGDRGAYSRINRRLLLFIILMFGIYFVDSLGFLRLMFTPAYMDTAWQSSGLTTRLSIGGAHVLGALIAGALYAALDEKMLMLWIFGVFALVQLMYVFDARAGIDTSSVLAMPMLYAIAVSLYTVVNFAIWSDLSTPESISVNSALGVALSGWTATFISTALAINWRLNGMALDAHLSRVSALAMIFFLVTLAVSFFTSGGTSRPQGGRV